MEIEETMTSAQPTDVGGDLMIIVGVKEMADRTKRLKLRHTRITYGQDEQRESEEEEAILDGNFFMNCCFRILNFIHRKI